MSGPLDLIKPRQPYLGTETAGIVEGLCAHRGTSVREEWETIASIVVLDGYMSNVPGWGGQVVIVIGTGDPGYHHFMRRDYDPLGCPHWSVVYQYEPTEVIP